MKVISPINDIGTKTGRKLELKRLNIKRLELVSWYNSDACGTANYSKRLEVATMSDMVKNSILAIENPALYQEMVEKYNSEDFRILGDYYG